MDATYRADLRDINDLNFSRFDAKLEQRLAQLDATWGTRWTELDAKLEQRLAQLKGELLAEIGTLRGEVRGELGTLRGDTMAAIPRAQARRCARTRPPRPHRLSRRLGAQRPRA